MLRRIRLPMSILLLAGFAGCYTQLRDPREASVQESPPPAAGEEPVYWPTRIDVYFYPAFPMSPFTDPWDYRFYHPYRNRWIARIVLFDSYDPFWASSTRFAYGYVAYDLWDGWYPMEIVYPASRYWGLPPPRPSPAPAHTVVPRPSIRRAGFDSEVPSAAAIRRLSGAVQTSSPVKAAPASQPSQEQHGSTAPPEAPSPPSAQDPGTQAQPAPKQKDDEEPSKEEKREEKREENRRRGGMN